MNSVNNPKVADKIYFEKATLAHKDLIFGWLEEPHMKEFWDNSQEHKDDILNFINGKKQHYFYGTTMYWVGFLDDQPYCFLLTDQIRIDQEDVTDLHKAQLSKIGNTISIDFGIGNKTFLGKGLAAPTLKAFVEFYNAYIDPNADTFFIDPNDNNPRAKHVYEKAGFRVVDKFTAEKGYFIGDESILMVKTIALSPKLIKATLADNPALQKMGKLYENDMLPYCSYLPGWLKIYLEGTGRHAFIIKVGKENIGFALINKAGTMLKVDWNMGEFFILKKFQGQSFGKQAAMEILDQFAGLWEVVVIPKNTGAHAFWQKVITTYSDGNFSKKTKAIDYDPDNPKRIIFQLKSRKN